MTIRQVQRFSRLKWVPTFRTCQDLGFAFHGRTLQQLKLLNDCKRHQSLKLPPQTNPWLQLKLLLSISPRWCECWQTLTINAYLMQNPEARPKTPLKGIVMSHELNLLSPWSLLVRFFFSWLFLIWSMHHRSSTRLLGAKRLTQKKQVYIYIYIPKVTPNLTPQNSFRSFPGFPSSF